MWIFVSRPTNDADGIKAKTTLMQHREICVQQSFITTVQHKLDVEQSATTECLSHLDNFYQCPSLSLCCYIFALHLGSTGHINSSLQPGVNRWQEPCLRGKQCCGTCYQPNGGTVTQTDGAWRLSEPHKSLHGAPGRLKAFFDRTAERGITLPNEQAQSRGISLCSGCIVVAAACLAQSVCSLWGPAAQCLHSYSQKIF